ncbi:ribonuclease H-like domain-containing protein [Tanacetum coccineum]
MKIPIIKKGEYDIWSMRMRQYICHTDHNMWDIIVNGDPEDEATPSDEQSSPPEPKTAKQLAARRNQERIKSILLLAIPDEYLLKFHNVPEAKSLWAAIKSRFGGNEESKKMQKNKLISQLEIHGAYVSKEDINQKFLRSLPPSWSQIALIMRNKPDIDEVDIDDLYNNLRVYEDELKRSSGSNSASQNLAFLSSENTNSTNEVSTASGDFGVSTAGGINQVPSTPSAHDIAYSFLAQPTTSPQLENEDFQQMDGDDLEELDLRWQVAMLTVRVKKFIQRTGRNMDFKEKRPVSLDKSKIECYNCHRKGHFAREFRSKRNQGRRPYGDNGKSNAQITESSSQALVAQDGLGGYYWSNDFEVEPVNYALMAISSLSSSSDSEKKGEETLRVFYLRFSLLLNDMNIYNVKLEQFQVNTKFLNTLPPEWSKFVTDVKLVQDLHTTNIDQLHAYLGQHEFHANEVRLNALDMNAIRVCLLWTYTPGASGRNSTGKQKTVICYNYKGEGHMSKQCTKPKGNGMIRGFKDNVVLMLCLRRISENIDREFALEKKIKQLDNIVYKRDQSAQTVHMLTNPYFFYNHTTKQAHGFQNPFYLKKAQQLEPKLYNGNVIKNTSAIMIHDSEETLMLAEESHSKMLLKQHDLMMLENKVNTTPVDYAALNQLSQDFEKQFVPQTALSTEQAFWSQNFMNSSNPNPS